jgi:hypothetical protein
MSTNIRKEILSSTASKGTLPKIWSVREFNKNQPGTTDLPYNQIAAFFPRYSGAKTS